MFKLKKELLYTRGYKINRVLSFLFAFILAVITAGIVSNPPCGIKLHYNIRALLGISVFLLSNLFFTRKYRKRNVVIHTPCPSNWSMILEKYVPYFHLLKEDEKYLFIKKIQIFLEEVMITGINMQVNEVTKVLVGAAAVIPVFKIPDWNYSYLTDVFICQDNLHENVELLRCKDDVLGLVIHNKTSIYLSQDALIENFKKRDGYNIGIHEFVHKIDEETGAIDGVPPEPILSKKERKRWKEIIDYEMEKIRQNESDFREYALTSRSEFIAVAAEYFFERPLDMKEKHNALYHMMARMSRQNLAAAVSSEARKIFSN